MIFMTVLYSELLLSPSLPHCYINRITHTHMIVKKSMYRLEMNAKKFIRTRVYLLRYRVVQLDLTPEIEVSYLLMS